MGESVFDQTTAAIFGLTLICSIVLFLMSKKRHMNLPPGPGRYSIFSSLLTSGKVNFMEVKRKYKEKYGDIFTIHIFNSVHIVCTGYELVKEMLVKNGHIFKNRTERHIRNEVFGNKGAIASTGEAWQQNRRFALRTLRDFGMGKNKLEMKIHEEINNLIDVIDAKNGEAFDLDQLLHYSTSNVIASVIFGERFDYDDDGFNEFLRLIHDTSKMSVSYKRVWQQYIPGDLFRVREHLNIHRDLRKFVESQTYKVMNNFDGNNVNCFIDAYLKGKRSANTEEGMPYDEDDLITLTYDLFGAGSETTASVMSWGLIFLMHNDTVQTAFHEELDSTVLCERLPSCNDKPRLPFVVATTLEILRMANAVPFTTRVVSQDTEIRGYTIPASATILVDLESVLMDSRHWEEPQKFHPARFLSDNKVNNRQELVFFGLGPRNCLGESLARMEIFLFLSALLQRFKFLPPEGEDLPSLEGVYGIVRVPKPFKLRAIRRNKYS